MTAARVGSKRSSAARRNGLNPRIGLNRRIELNRQIELNPRIYNCINIYFFFYKIYTLKIYLFKIHDINGNTILLQKDAHRFTVVFLASPEMSVRVCFGG